MSTLRPRARGATSPVSSPQAHAARGAAGRQALPGLVRWPGRAPPPAPAAAIPGWVDVAMTAVDVVANRVAALLPPQGRRWLLRAAGASAGTIGLLGLVVTAEALRVRSHPFLPETLYDRILRIPGTGGHTDGPPLRLAVLGDSTTTGIGTDRVEETYPAIVGRALAVRGPVEVHVLGRAGSRLADVIAEQLPLAKVIRPDLILLVAGANDATHVTPLLDVRSRTRRILDELAGTPLVLAGVPRLSLARVVAFPLRELSTWRGIRVTAVMRRTANGKPDVRFVSLSMRPTALDGVSRAWLSTDRFHPSAYGYSQWAAAFIPALLAADPRAPAPEQALEELIAVAAEQAERPARRVPVVAAWRSLRVRVRRLVQPAPEAAAG